MNPTVALLLGENTLNQAAHYHRHVCATKLLIVFPLQLSVKDQISSITKDAPYLGCHFQFGIVNQLSHTKPKGYTCTREIQSLEQMELEQTLHRVICD